VTVQLAVQHRDFLGEALSYCKEAWGGGAPPAVRGAISLARKGSGKRENTYRNRRPDPRRTRSNWNRLGNPGSAVAVKLILTLAPSLFYRTLSRSHCQQGGDKDCKRTLTIVG
jgi:hypothetical protein